MLALKNYPGSAKGHVGEEVSLVQEGGLSDQASGRGSCPPGPGALAAWEPLQLAGMLHALVPGSWADRSGSNADVRRTSLESRYCDFVSR